jgi:RimJ/RimL family protein N-acetyltransferase
MPSSVYQLVSELKRNKIDVAGPEGSTIAFLKPINPDSLMGIEQLAETMTKWRNKAMPYFKTGFVATKERTCNWLINSVIPAKDKVLFLIYVDDKLIGQFGLCNITFASAELDNAIRGERGGRPDLFDYVENTILKTAFDILGVETIYGRLFSNNFLAMSLHKRFGFKENRRSPLNLVKNENEWQYVECSEGEANVRFQYVELMLSCDHFNQLI